MMMEIFRDTWADRLACLAGRLALHIHPHCISQLHRTHPKMLYTRRTIFLINLNLFRIKKIIDFRLLRRPYCLSRISFCVIPTYIAVATKPREQINDYIIYLADLTWVYGMSLYKICKELRTKRFIFVDLSVYTCLRTNCCSLQWYEHWETKNYLS